MNDNLPTTHERRVAEQRRLLRRLLNLQTDAELRAVDWVGTARLETLERLTAMVGRAVDGAYERGFAEGRQP